MGQTAMLNMLDERVLLGNVSELPGMKEVLSGRSVDFLSVEISENFKKASAILYWTDKDGVVKENHATILMDNYWLAEDRYKDWNEEHLRKRSGT